MHKEYLLTTYDVLDINNSYQALDTLVSPYINIRHNLLDCDRFDIFW